MVLNYILRGNDNFVLIGLVIRGDKGVQVIMWAESVPLSSKIVIMLRCVLNEKFQNFFFFF